MTLGRRRNKPALRTWCAAEVSCVREGAQAGARRSGRGRLYNVGQITRRLSDVDVAHEGAKLVGDVVTNW